MLADRGGTRESFAIRLNQFLDEDSWITKTEHHLDLTVQ
jgi:hypothetical protein